MYDKWQIYGTEENIVGIQKSKFAQRSFHHITVQGGALGSHRPECLLLAVSWQTSYLTFLSFDFSKCEDDHLDLTGLSVAHNVLGRYRRSMNVGSYPSSSVFTLL